MPIDFRAYTLRRDARAIAEVDYRLRMTRATRQRGNAFSTYLDFFLIGGMGLGALVMVVAAISVGVGLVATLSAGGAGDPVGLIILTAAALAFSLVLMVVLRPWLRRRRDPATWWRLESFARDNSLAFSPWSPDPGYPSAVFRTEGEVAAFDHLTSTSGYFFDLGNLFLPSASGGPFSAERRIGFVAVHLGRRVPDAFLDVPGNGALGHGNVPLEVAGLPRSPLPEPYRDRAVLRAPQGRRGVDDVLTPALLDLLLSPDLPLDAQLTGEWLFVFSPRPFRMGDGAVVARLLQVVDTVHPGAAEVAEADRRPVRGRG